MDACGAHLDLVIGQDARHGVEQPGSVTGTEAEDIVMASLAARERQLGRQWEGTQLAGHPARDGGGRVSLYDLFGQFMLDVVEDIAVGIVGLCRIHDQEAVEHMVVARGVDARLKDGITEVGKKTAD